MKRFLRLTAYFSLLVILALCIGEVIVRQLPTSYSYKDQFLKNHGESISTLVLGSSHTYYGIQPAILSDSTFNLANISQTPEYDLELLRHYLPYCKNLKRIIVPISYFTFRESALEDGVEWKLGVQYKTQMHLPIHSDISFYNLNLTDYNAYFGRLRSLVLKQDMNRCDSLGFGMGFTLDKRDPAWETKGKERAEALSFPASERKSKVLDCYEEMITLCQKHRIEFILITTPTWHTFRENADAMQLKEMRKEALALSGSHRLKIFDHYDDPRFSEEDFHDTDHLSDQGAKKFTLILRDELDMANCKPPYPRR